MLEVEAPSSTAVSSSSIATHVRDRWLRTHLWLLTDSEESDGLLLWYDGPPPDTRPCSPALYRRLQALDRKGMHFVDCRINRNGVAVCRKDMPRVITPRKD